MRPAIVTSSEPYEEPYGGKTREADDCRSAFRCQQLSRPADDTVGVLLEEGIGGKLTGLATGGKCFIWGSGADRRLGASRTYMTYTARPLTRCVDMVAKRAFHFSPFTFHL
jgi:hypothetical protein